MDFLRHDLLTILIFLPTLGAGLVLLGRRRQEVRWAAMGAVLATFAASLLLLIIFDWHAGNAYGYADQGGTVQLVQRAWWIKSLGVQYLVGIDGLSFPLVMLIVIVSIPVCIAAWNVQRWFKPFMALLLVMETGMLGVLLSLDLALLLMFFLITVLAAFFLIRTWGQPRASHGAGQFLIYMLMAGLAILIAMVGLYMYSRRVMAGGSLDVIWLARRQLPLVGGASGPAARGFFGLLMFGFLIVLAGVPFHSWASEAINAAPTPVAMALSGLFPAMGGYGILRIAYPLLPEAAKFLWLPVAILGLLTMIYAALAAMAQTDFKRLAIYSSISQMGMVALAAAMLTDTAAKGAICVMVAHGLITPMLLFLAGMARDRGGRLQLGPPGLSANLPVLRAFGLFALLAALPMPLLGAFVGQVLVLLGAFQALRVGGILYSNAAAHGHLHGFVIAAWTVSAIACLGIIPTAGYVVQGARMLFAPAPEESPNVDDANNRELTVLTLPAVLLVLLGIFPMQMVLVFCDRAIAAIYGVLLKSHS